MGGKRSIEVRRTAGALGAEIEGVNLGLTKVVGGEPLSPYGSGRNSRTATTQTAGTF